MNATSTVKVEGKSEAEKEVNELKESLEQLSAELHSARQSAKRLDVTLQLNRTFDKLKKQITDAALGQLRKHNRKLRGTNDDLRGEVARLQELVKSKSDEIGRLYTTDYYVRSQRQAEELKQNQEQITQQKKEIEELNLRILRQSRTIRNLREDIRSLVHAGIVKAGGDPARYEILFF